MFYNEHYFCKTNYELRPMKAGLIVVIGMLLVAIAPRSISACQCYDYELPYCEQVSRADTVFIGTVRSIQYNETGGLDESLIKFGVEEVFKGNTESTVDVGYIFGSSCSWAKFEPGERWVVFGYRNRSGSLYIPFCTGSHKYNSTGENIDFLNDLKQGKTTESIAGKLTVGGEEGVRDIPVTITNGKTNITGRSDADGLWDVSVPGPGNYKVSFSMPFSAALFNRGLEFPFKALSIQESRSDFEYEAPVEKGLCNYKNLIFGKIDLKASASISGRLLDASGAPVKGGFVHLAKWAIDEETTLKERTFKFTDENGAFTFHGLREGRYVVLLNPRNYPQHNEPYLRSYLPGVPTFSGAFVIELEQGKEIKVPDFKLPKKVPTRTIEIEAVWPDGKPVVKWGPEPDDTPTIAIHNSDGEYIEQAEESRSGVGKYTFSVFEGFSYVIEVRATGDHDYFNGFVKIPSRGTPRTLKVVLRSKTGDAENFVQRTRQKEE